MGEDGKLRDIKIVSSTDEEFSKELVRVPGAKVFLSLRLPGFRRAAPSDIPWPGVLQSIECSCRPFGPTGRFRLPALTKASFRRTGSQKQPVAYATSCIPFCGGGGIRTPGTLPFNSFQDCRHRPLGHTSKRIANLYIFREFCKNCIRKSNRFYFESASRAESIRGEQYATNSSQR